VRTITFGALYCFFVISHDRRRILHCNVTRHPASLWIVQQLRETFPFDSAPPFPHSRSRRQVWPGSPGNRAAAHPALRNTVKFWRGTGVQLQVDYGKGETARYLWQVRAPDLLRGKPTRNFLAPYSTFLFALRCEAALISAGPSWWAHVQRGPRAFNLPGSCRRE
jgi:hypothetical protein